MALEDLTLQLSLLLFPGIIGMVLVNAFTAYKAKNPFHFAISSLCRMADYGILALAYGVLGFRFHLSDALRGTQNALDFIELAWVTLVGLAVAILLASSINRNWIYKVARMCGVTRQTGAPDLWTHLHNQDGYSTFVTLRDHQTGFAYQGLVQIFSESHDVRELILHEGSL